MRPIDKVRRHLEPSKLSPTKNELLWNGGSN